ncbi:DUF6430 domain-containing protein [Pseudomonas sp. RTB3]|uniref:macro domain-containing protein n=1 Tax=unclassified Pseudomonas TaxID=196821 RepID=UPI002B23A352|nr:MULTISPECIES: macro domain-containing protein [unclassified Pseudomonas]MEB0009846.1 DUF6430 domain-containing protein [Pseudomonas sp. RTB2]MEB0017258.1 DUF6430 domain-containing protein [Pseudomonas sp. RTB3]MEB0270635.1 DUF6430 domain-containing protein [Pseudomonas sp. 5B4]
MRKVDFLDRQLRKNFQEKISAISMVFSLLLIFVEIPANLKAVAGVAFVLVIVVFYITLWLRANKLKLVELDIEGSKVTIKSGDIFLEPGLKVIAFNEYFDTIVDDKIISGHSLNGVFITHHLPATLAKLDKHIENYPFDADEVAEVNEARTEGKKQRYKIGTLCVYDDFILAAFSKFDKNNRAVLTMPEYLEFLINFWDRINKVYAQQSVSTPVFGSGITRIKEHKNITDEDLLKIMLWTFRISEMRFKYPAKLTIVIHKDKIANINLLDIKSAKNGL